MPILLPTGVEAPRNSLRWHMIVKLTRRSLSSCATFVLLALTSGCVYFPDARQRDRVHNPFPQLKRVAVLPFFNQSNEPTVDTELVAEKYYAALQSVPGFEVLPVGVAKTQWLQYVMANGEPKTGKDFQQLAKQMGVEALVVGSVTDFEAYYPPRMAMTVHWYAANEGFHPIPAGYGLPWGTENEKYIPKRIAREAEFELARSQLATQSPIVGGGLASDARQPLAPASGEIELAPPQTAQANVRPDHFADPFADEASQQTSPVPIAEGGVIDSQFHEFMADSTLPLDWPDPTDLIPDPPSPERPLAKPNHLPILTHTRLYRGDDPYFTKRLADHVETGDDARPESWQGYLKRSDDFIDFCCQLHITEMLESRGGSDQRDLILRWPLSRY